MLGNWHVENSDRMRAVRAQCILPFCDDFVAIFLSRHVRSALHRKELSHIGIRYIQLLTVEVVNIDQSSSIKHIEEQGGVNGAATYEDEVQQSSAFAIVLVPTRIYEACGHESSRSF